MFSGSQGYSLSDIAAVTGTGYGRDGDMGWGNGGAWWIIILFLFVFCGWGGNGFGGGYGNGAGLLSGALTRADLCQDMNFGQLENGVRGIQQGICDSTYALNNSINTVGMNMMSGFHGVDNAICSLGSAMQGGFNNTQVAMLQGFNALQAQGADCCCTTQRSIDQVRFQNSQDTCDIINALHSEGEATRALINANTMQDLRDKLAERDREVMTRDFQLSQQAQNAYLVNEIKPCARPAYLTCSPYTAYNQTSCGCGCGNNFVA